MKSEDAISPEEEVSKSTCHAKHNQQQITATERLLARRRPPLYFYFTKRNPVLPPCWTTAPTIDITLCIPCQEQPIRGPNSLIGPTIFTQLAVDPSAVGIMPVTRRSKAKTSSLMSATKASAAKANASIYLQSPEDVGAARAPSASRMVHSALPVASASMEVSFNGHRSRDTSTAEESNQSTSQTATILVLATGNVEDATASHNEAPAAAVETRITAPTVVSPTDVEPTIVAPNASPANTASPSNTKGVAASSATVATPELPTNAKHPAENDPPVGSSLATDANAKLTSVDTSFGPVGAASKEGPSPTVTGLTADVASAVDKSMEEVSSLGFANASVDKAEVPGSDAIIEAPRPAAGNDSKAPPNSKLVSYDPVDAATAAKKTYAPSVASVTGISYGETIANVAREAGVDQPEFTSAPATATAQDAKDSVPSSPSLFTNPGLPDADSIAQATDALAAEVLDATDGAFTTVADAIEAGLDAVTPSCVA